MSDPWVPVPSTTAPEIGLAAAILVPALTAMAVLVWDSSHRERLATVGAAFTTLISLGLLAVALHGRTPSIDGGEFAPNIPIAFEVDPLGGILGVTVSGAVLVGIPSVVSHHRRQRTPIRPRTLAGMLAAVSTALTAVYAGNLLILFIGLELLTVVTYPLIVTEERTATRRAGYTYLAYLLTAGLIFLVGMRVLYAEIGTLTFISGGIPELEAVAASDPWIVRAAFGLLAFGITTKAALVPLHSWFVRARMTPIPILGVIFAIVVSKIGSFTVARLLLDVFGLETAMVVDLGLPLLAIGSLTVLFAGGMAIGAPRFLDRLLYLTLAGSALSFLAFGAIREPWIHWGIGFIPVHATALLLAFIGIGHLEVATGRASSRFGTLIAGSLLGVMMLVWLVGLLTLGLGPFDRGGLIVTLGLTAVLAVHVLALWPILLDPDLARYPRRTMDALLIVPPVAGVILAGACSLHRLMDDLAAGASRIAIGVMNGIRAPGETLEMLFPTRVTPRYRDYRKHTLGQTGTKLGIEGSLYVLVLVLAVGLILGLL